MTCDSMEPILAFLKNRQGQRVALAVHQRPDGDALGSAMGLADALRNFGCTAKVLSPEPLPPYLSFIVDRDLVDETNDPEWWRAYDCLGVLDCGEEGRLEPVIAAAADRLPVFTVDHHASSKGLGEARWIEPHASSTGEMVLRLCHGAGWPLSPFAAQALWTAIVTDTGRFSFENTTAAALEAARDCVAAGADPAAAASTLYQCVTMSERRLQKLVLERMELLEEGRLAVAWLEEADFRRAGSGVEDAQNLINLLRDIAGVEVAIFFYAPPDGAGIKASFRTRSPHDALLVTQKFGGGGHKRAAGCSLTGTMWDARNAVVAETRRVYF